MNYVNITTVSALFTAFKTLVEKTVVERLFSKTIAKAFAELSWKARSRGTNIVRSSQSVVVLVKLCRPMRKCQCLLHTAQMNLWSREK